MKKGKQLAVVEISKCVVTAKTTDGSNVKLSRNERNVLSRYREPDYVEIIKKTFGNPNVLSDDFTVIKNGEVKFTCTK
ncbi:MAG: hypothetical protein IKA36_05385 [Clostridia bacterium]|mgnify:CR=1 FL=1|nr:hypothetical protein [Clostridia bacterium]